MNNKEAEQFMEWVKARVPEPKREWVGLTHADVEWLYVHHSRHQVEGMRLSGWDSFALAIEEKLKEKNGG
jgi:hypothetical protein